jgi:uncharacterized protein YfiM (DUF2279 family)
MIPVDKQKHAAAGFIVGGLSISSKQVKHPFWTSVLMATSAGAAKELYDSRTGGTSEVKDVYFTVAGGAVSGTIGYLIKRRHDKRKKAYLRNRWMHQQFFRY